MNTFYRLQRKHIFYILLIFFRKWSLEHTKSKFENLAVVVFLRILNQ